MVVKKQYILFVVIALVILLFLQKPKDLTITANYYDQNGNLVGHSQPKLGLMPMAIICNGDSCTTDTVQILSKNIAGIQYEIAVTNIGNALTNFSYYTLLPCEGYCTQTIPPITYIGTIDAGETIKFNTSINPISVIPFNSEKFINIIILANIKERQEQKTIIWKFKRYAACKPLSDPCEHSTTGKSLGNDTYGCPLVEITCAIGDGSDIKLCCDYTHNLYRIGTVDSWYCYNCQIPGVHWSSPLGDWECGRCSYPKYTIGGAQ